MSYVRGISWAENIVFAKKDRLRRGITPDGGAGDVIRGILMGMTLGIAAWAALIVTFVYVL